MTFYEVDVEDGEPALLFETLKQAQTFAAKMATQLDASRTITIRKMIMLPITKELIVRIVNHEGGYVAEYENVATLHGALRENDEPARLTLVGKDSE